MKQLIGSILYQLSRIYGQAATYKRVTKGAVDVESGQINESREEYRVSKAILMDMKKERTYQLRGISPSFNYGGTFDETMRVVIIRANQLPVDFIPIMDDRIEIEGSEWSVVKIDLLIAEAGFALTVKQVDRRE
jgi:hypothetical protein